MRANARLGGLVLIGFACAWPVAAAADPATVERARAALAAGNAMQAYDELAPLQDRMSGQPEYDYLLGVAALDSGRNDEAIIAFERVLALIPNHAGAQMDIGGVDEPQHPVAGVPPLLSRVRTSKRGVCHTHPRWVGHDASEAPP